MRLGFQDDDELETEPLYEERCISSQRLRAPSYPEIDSFDRCSNVNASYIARLPMKNDNRESPTAAALLFHQTLRLSSSDDIDCLLKSLCESRARKSMENSSAYHEFCNALHASSLKEKTPVRSERIDMQKEVYPVVQSFALAIAGREREKQAKSRQLKMERQALVTAVETTLREHSEELARLEEANRAKIKLQEETIVQSKPKETDRSTAISIESKISTPPKPSPASLEPKRTENPAANEDLRGKLELQPAKVDMRSKKEDEYAEMVQKRLESLQNLQQKASQITADPDSSVKKIRVELKKQAGACNQISSAPSSIQNVVNKINCLLQYAKSSGSMFFDFALDLVAGNLTRQARILIDHRACYPIAHVIVQCCQANPELKDLILAYFYQMSVFTIPKSVPYTKDKSVAEYKRALGFETAVGETNDLNGLEHVTEYTRRMTMIVALLAAIMQTKPLNQKRLTGISIGDCWAWIARLVNRQLHLMTAPVLLTILEVAGYELSVEYGLQFRKLLSLIANKVCCQLSKDAKSGAANTAGQLETFIAQYTSRGYRLLEPEGRKLKETKLTEMDEERTEGDRSFNNRFGGRGRGNRRY